jgi:hypothetical protein
MSKEIREMIDKVKNFKPLVNERYNINIIPNDILLLALTYKNAGKFFLYDIKAKRVVGFIVFADYVDRVYSEYNGFGAFLYESAMTYVYPNGISMSREGSTSEEAINVWKIFNQRNDVKKEKMNSNKTSYKKIHLPTSTKYKDNPEKIKNILELEDTKFFYNYGKDKLNKLIEIGKKYMYENNISENDLDNMEIDIDFSDE